MHRRGPITACFRKGKKSDYYYQTLFRLWPIKLLTANETFAQSHKNSYWRTRIYHSSAVVEECLKVSSSTVARLNVDGKRRWTDDWYYDASGFIHPNYPYCLTLMVPTCLFFILLTSNSPFFQYCRVCYPHQQLISQQTGTHNTCARQFIYIIYCELIFGWLTYFLDWIINA